MNKTMMSVVELSMQMWGPRKALLFGERRSDGAIRGRASLTVPNERNQRRRAEGV